MVTTTHPLQRCTDCRQVKQLSEFFPSSFTATGTVSRCKTCVFKRAREHRNERERLGRAADAAQR